jgi:pimeloyl-ACP methyl ester carboxylesterase
MESVGAYAEWLAASLPGSVPAPRALVGHGLGAAVALSAAADHPELVDGLVLLGAGVRLAVDDDALSRASEDFPAECERLVRESLAAPEAPLVERAMSAVAAAGAEALVADYTASRAFDAAPRLREVGQPTLVISGAADRLAPPGRGEELVRGLPSALMAIVAEAGHLVMLEQPGPVNLLLAGYLARLELTLDER